MDILNQDVAVADAPAEEEGTVEETTEGGEDKL